MNYIEEIVKRIQNATLGYWETESGEETLKKLLTEVDRRAREAGKLEGQLELLKEQRISKKNAITNLTPKE